MAHTHYKGTGKMHSFRGLLDGSSGAAVEETISIEGSVGSIAWHIVKFDIIPQAFNTDLSEAVVQVWRESPGTAPFTIDFSNGNLLAAGLWTSNVTGQNYPFNKNIIFDNALFVRNIHVSHQCAQNSSMNYYIELEEVKVSAAGMAQLSLAASRRMQSDV